LNAVLHSRALEVVEKGRSLNTVAPPPKPAHTPWCHICASSPEWPATIGVAPEVPLNCV